MTLASQPAASKGHHFPDFHRHETALELHLNTACTIWLCGFCVVFKNIHVLRVSLASTFLLLSSIELHEYTRFIYARYCW